MRGGHWAAGQRQSTADGCRAGALLVRKQGRGPALPRVAGALRGPDAGQEPCGPGCTAGAVRSRAFLGR
jgi:hypothetical protein